MSPIPVTKMRTRRKQGRRNLEFGRAGVFGGKSVSLSCTDLPAGASCDFMPQSLTPGPEGGTVQLVVTTDGSGDRRDLPGSAALSIGVGLAIGLLGGFGVGPRRRRMLMPIALILMVVGAVSACSDDVLGPPSVGASTPPGRYEFHVVATAGGQQRIAEVTLSVREPEHHTPTSDPAILQRR